jgi:hypothetical protein
VLLEDVDDAPVRQLGDGQVRDGFENALVLHRLGERAELRQELKARLGLLAGVDVAAGGRDRLDRGGGPGKRPADVHQGPLGGRARCFRIETPCCHW